MGIQENVEQVVVRVLDEVDRLDGGGSVTNATKFGGCCTKLHKTEKIRFFLMLLDGEEGEKRRRRGETL